MTSSERASRGRRGVAIAAIILLLLAGCTGDDGDGAGGRTGGGGGGAAAEAPKPTPAPEQLEAALAGTIGEAPDCDWLGSGHCMYPFPSSRFETDDEDTETGRRLAIPAAAMPASSSGPADPDPFARSDGWGVGTPIMVSIPEVDVEASGFAPETDLARSVADDSATVLLDLTTGERLAHWAELDGRPEIPDADRSTVLIRPAQTLPEGHRIAVAISRPLDRAGDEVPVQPGFQVYRDNLTTDIEAVEARRPAMDDLLASLTDAGLVRDELWLAWDFQVMSTENLTGELLAMRDQAMAELGDGPPPYRITEVVTDDEGEPLPEGVAKWVRGTFDVPSFIEGDGSPGQLMARDDDGAPRLVGTYTAEFTCVVTTDQVEGTGLAKPVVYGHGLLGSYHEAERGDLGTATAGLMLCGTYWVGMSDPDIGYAVTALQDIDQFPSVADRLRQAIVNQLVLARLIGHPDGIAADPELAAPDGSSSVDTTEVFYEGHSQGGIMGFAATAVSTEWTKAVIGVPGVNYSLLLTRSNNWQTYGPVISGGYADPTDVLVVLALLQQQWDRAEGSGYARYTLGGLPDTPDHQVLVEVAAGDAQVANQAADLAARSAGIPLRVPQVDEGRLPWKTPAFGFDEVEAGETAESLVVYWDSGVLGPPLGSLSPDMAPAWQAECGAEDDSPACADPHEFPRRTPEAQEQRNRFFATGKIDDVCGDGPCMTEPRDG